MLLVLLLLLYLLLLRRRSLYFAKLVADGSQLVGCDVLQIGLFVEFHQQLHGVQFRRQRRGRVGSLRRRKALGPDHPIVPVAIQERLACQGKDGEKGWATMKRKCNTFDAVREVNRQTDKSPTGTDGS